VKVFGIIAVVVVVLFVVLLLTGRGHGPGRHASSSGVIENGEQQRRR
jgi:preprotein translocase subunit SecG